MITDKLLHSKNYSEQNSFNINYTLIFYLSRAIKKL